MVLRQENTEDHIKILTDNSFCINTIRDYATDFLQIPFTKHILQLADQLLRARDTKQLQTHIGKFKSYMDIAYNEAADSAARAVVYREVSPDITFNEADPPVGGLCTWPQIRHITPNKPDNIHKITSLKTGI